jgi:Flp pilus assembly protein TadD
VEQSRNNAARAKEMYQKALAVQSDSPMAANNLAYMMLERGENVDVALSLAQTARRAMPDSPNVADTLAYAYYQKGVYNSAIELLQEAAKRAPQNATVHYHLGMAYQKTNKLVQARQEFEKALQLDPKSSYAETARKALVGMKG